MKHRELILFGSVVGLLACCSLLFLRGDPPLPPSDPTPVVPAASRPDEEHVAAPAAEVIPGEADIQHQPGAAPDSGTIAGSISMTAEVALNVNVFTIEVAEAVNTAAHAPAAPQPFKLYRSFRVEPTEGTPRFELTGIPFSEYGYNVSAQVLDHNGDEQFVRITREKPVARVHLGLRGGVEYSVLVRDQDRNPLPSVEVHMVPKGPPVGRRGFHGVSDSYGAVLFEKVLKGDYSLSVGPPTAPIVEPKLVTVAQTGIQAEHVEIPRGGSVSFFVTAPGGLGLSNVEVKATAIDTPQFKRYTLATDVSGNAVFKHLAPGDYQVEFSAHGFARETKKISVKTDETQPMQTVELTHTH